MMVRGSSEDQRNALKMAFRIAVKHGGGGEVVSTFTRARPPMLSTYAAPHETERFAPLDVALDVDLSVGEPINARALAAAQGYDLVRTIDPAASGRIGLGDLSQLIDAAHGVERDFLSALEDSIVSPKEKLDLNSGIEKLMSVLSGLQRKVNGS